MSKLQRKLWHRLDHRQGAWLGSVAALDAALLIPLGYGLLGQNTQLVLVVAPTYSTLFLVLAVSLTAFAERGVVSWQLVCAILVTGPVGAGLALRPFRNASSG